MTTADWALIVSLFSLAVAGASFVWNVWSKFIFPKPKIRVGFAIISVFPAPDPPPNYARLNVTNYGPGDLVTDVSMVRTEGGPFKRDGWALLNPIPDIHFPHAPGQGPFAGGLPKKLGVGENFSLFYPYDAKTFLTEPLTAIGVKDSFGRNHWADRRDLRKVLAKFKEDFPAASE